MELDTPIIVKLCCVHAANKIQNTQESAGIVTDSVL